jgi:hypothetical protein
MTLLTIVYLFMASLWTSAPGLSNADQSNIAQQELLTPPVIDSTDMIIINMDLMYIFGQIIEIPVFIQSDEVINALDFSMALNIDNLEFESIVDHTGINHDAHFNTDDLKLRFTSNSFSSYPKDPVKVVSIRMRVLSGAVFASDIQSLRGYLNGDRCTVVLQFSGEVIPVSNKEIITNETFITPNPVVDEMYIQSEEDGTLDLFDLHGKAVIQAFRLHGQEANTIDVQQLPNGSYTARVITKDHKVKTQQIVKQE